MTCISAGYPKTAQSSFCRKRTPERVKLLQQDKERLQARVGELEASLASHAVTKIDSDKIALLESELSLQAQRTKDAITTTRQLESRAEAETARANKAEAKVSGLRKAAEAMRKAAARALQSSAKRVSVSADGIRQPVHTVKAASRADGGMRMALEEVSTTTKGSFQTRVMGGLQYRLPECVFAMQSDVDEGIGSRSTRNKREEANMYRRAAADGAAVEVVLTPRPGLKTRRTAPGGPVQAFARPSLSTMERVIRGTFRNLMYREARERLPRANTVVLITDGKSFGGRHACGVLLCMYFMEPGDKIDPFGNGPETRSVLPVPLQLQMVCNKIVKDTWDRHGNKWALQTPFHVIRALRLAGLEDVAKKYGHLLCTTTDAASDNRGLGKDKITMDNMSGKNSLLEALMVSGREWSEVDQDLRGRSLLDILLVFHHGNDTQLRQITRNLNALRKAERSLRELQRKAVQIKSVQEKASINVISQSQTHAAVSANAAGASSPSRICASADMLSDLSTNFGETGSPACPVDSLVAAAKQAVEAAAAKLAADAAAAAAGLDASHPSSARSPAPLPPSAPKEPEPIRLQVSGPLMQVPETVRRIFHLYEEKHVRPLLARQTLLRWWMRRWLWISHLQLRAILKIEIQVWEILTEIENLKLEVEFLKLDVNPSREPIKAGSVKDQANLAKTLRASRAIKVNLRIRAFRIQSLAAWVQDLVTEMRRRATKNEKEKKTTKKLKKKTETEKKEETEKVRDGYCPAFGLLSMGVWRFIFHFTDQRIRMLLPSAAKSSASESPSRFLPLIEQKLDNETGEVHYHGHGQQCQNHAANNILDPCVRFLDHELLTRIIQGARCLKNIFIEDELMAAIDHLFSNRPSCREIDKHTDFFKRAKEGIASQAAAGRGVSLEEATKQMGYTEERGAQKTDTCAIVRWATTTKAADWQATWRIGYAFGLLRIGGIALDEQTEVDAAVSIFSHDGFLSDKFADLMLERKVAETFELLTGSRTLLQLFLLKFLHRFLFKPLMLVMGDNLECGDLMVGMGSIPRRMLRVLRRVIFVGGTWSRKLALGHRTNGAEYSLSKWSIRFLNPLCGERVRLMLGDGWDDPMHASILEGMVNAPSELIGNFRMLALKKDPLMPQEAELVFKESHPELFADPKRDSSYCLRMTQMQLLAQHVILDTAEQLEYCVRQNLQGVRSFLAGMMQTRWTSGSVSCKPDGQMLVQSAINYAHEMALADAVITLKLRDEMTYEVTTAIAALARKKPEMQGKDALRFWPAYVADAFSTEGVKDIQSFLGVSDEQRQNGEWGNHYNRLDSLNGVDSAGKVLCHTVLHRDGRLKVQVQEESPVPPNIYLYPLEWVQTLYWGFHPWWLRRNTCMHQAFLFKWNRVSELPKPLQEFPSAYRPSVKASNFSVSAKRLEQHWAYPALMYATRSQMNNESLTHFFSLPAFRHMTPADLMYKAQSFEIDASQELAQFTPLKQTFQVDKERRSVMKEDTHRVLAEKARKSGGWSNTRHGGEYRRPGHAVLDPNTKQGRKTLKRVNKLSFVVGVRRGKIIRDQPTSAGVQKRAPRQSAGAQKQPMQRGGVQNPDQLKKRASLTFKERAALAAVKRASAVKSTAQMRMAARGCRRAPRTGNDCRSASNRYQSRQAIAGASNDNDNDSDFIPTGRSKLAGRETEATRRSARRSSKGAGCHGGGGGGGGTEGDFDSDGNHYCDSIGDLEGGCGGTGVNSDSSDGDGKASVGEGKGDAYDELDLGMQLKLNNSGGNCEGRGGAKNLGASGETSGGCGARIAAGAAGGVTAGDGDAGRDSEGPGRRRGEGASGAIEDDSDSGGGSDVPISNRQAVRAARAQQPGGGNGEEACGTDIGGVRAVGGGSRCGKQKGRKASGVEPHLYHSDSDDDDTLPPPNLTLNKEQAALTIPINIWSFDFAALCGHLAWYANNQGSNKPQRQVWLMKEKDTAVLAKVGTHLEATITRRASPYLRKLLELKHFALASRDGKITFTVRCNSGRNLYLMYDSYAGAVVVLVEQITRPREDKTGNINEDAKWEETMVYRRVFDTRDAAVKSKGKPTNGEYMGEKYFRNLWKEESTNGIETFHAGDSIYRGDIRTLVGVVRWQKAGQKDLPKDYFSEYAEADLLHRGESVHQNPRK